MRSPFGSSSKKTGRLAALLAGAEDASSPSGAKGGAYDDMLTEELANFEMDLSQNSESAHFTSGSRAPLGQSQMSLYDNAPAYGQGSSEWPAHVGGAEGGVDSDWATPEQIAVHEAQLAFLAETRRVEAELEAAFAEVKRGRS